MDAEAVSEITLELAKDFSDVQTKHAFENLEMPSASDHCVSYVVPLFCRSFSASSRAFLSFFG
jgi:hypothetical protein